MITKKTGIDQMHESVCVYPGLLSLFRGVSSLKFRASLVVKLREPASED